MPFSNISKWLFLILILFREFIIFIDHFNQKIVMKIMWSLCNDYCNIYTILHLLLLFLSQTLSATILNNQYIDNNHGLKRFSNKLVLIYSIKITITIIIFVFIIIIIIIVVVVAVISHEFLHTSASYLPLLFYSFESFFSNQRLLIAFSLEFEWLQATSNLQDSSQYSGQSL